jgi:polyvinyl alcohol dehydrogenase (cytochrome)
MRRNLGAAWGVVAACSLSLGVAAAANAGVVARPFGDGSPVASGAVASPNWPAYEHGPAHNSATFTDATITTSNAGSLHSLWHFTADAPTQSGQPGRRLDASPTVVGDRVYIGSRTGMFYVLNANTGTVVWKKQLDYGSNTYCPAKGIVGTATVRRDPADGILTAYVPGAHYLYALNAATGAQRWKASIGPDTADGDALYANWASPTVAGGRIFMGLAANCEARLIRGGVVSLDQHTGAVQHTYYAVPAGKVGASVWSSEAASGGGVFATTGNPDPTGTTIDDAYSIVRLSASTLAKTDKWTVPLGQAADLDFGSSPTLFTATIGGTATSLVSACNKNGIYYAWSQANLGAGPVWSQRVGDSSAGGGQCLTSAAVDGHTKRLFVAANQTVIAGNAAAGGLRALSPATGDIIWEKPLPCTAIGSPTINGQVVAVPMYGCPTGVTPSVQLFSEADGAFLGSVPAAGKVFAQPVFASHELLVASEDGTLTAYGP